MTGLPYFQTPYNTLKAANVIENLSADGVELFLDGPILRWKIHPEAPEEARRFVRSQWATELVRAVIRHLSGSYQ